MDAEDSEGDDSHEGCDDGCGDPNPEAVGADGESDDGHDAEEIEEETAPIIRNTRPTGKSRDTSKSKPS